LHTSYDATLRLFDRRNIKQPLVEHDAGGGIWRVRWHPTDPDKLLLACMHDGFKVITAEDGFSRCVTTTRFDEHGKDALAYGVDWCGLSGRPGRGRASELGQAEEIVASCSFYDHQLRTWLTAV
jgi:diphthamide biosynthesis protein 7